VGTAELHRRRAHAATGDVGRIFRVAEALECGIEDYLEIKYLALGTRG
jgi:hypothetical protein